MILDGPSIALRHFGSWKVKGQRRIIVKLFLCHNSAANNLIYFEKRPKYSSTALHNPATCWSRSKVKNAKKAKIGYDHNSAAYRPINFKWRSQFHGQVCLRCLTVPRANTLAVPHSSTGRYACCASHCILSDLFSIKKARGWRYAILELHARNDDDDDRGMARLSWPGFLVTLHTKTVYLGMSGFCDSACAKLATLRRIWGPAQNWGKFTKWHRKCKNFADFC